MSIGILFSGQGAHKVGMGKSLYDQALSVRFLYERANDLLDFDFASVCFLGPEEILTETKVCQPALYVHGYALFQLLQEEGLHSPITVVLGLSLGELTSLAAAEVFDFETGLAIVAKRGELMQKACESQKGAMASLIGGSFDRVQALCTEFDVDIANLNCPGQIVVSGEEERILQLIEKAKGEGFKRVIPLNVAGAYHSRLMEPARRDFAEFLKDIPFKKPRFTVFTNTTGERIDEPEAIREALIKQIVSPVRWEDCMKGAAGEVQEFLECGPERVLTGLARRIDSNIKVTPLSEYEELQKVVKGVAAFA